VVSKNSSILTGVTIVKIISRDVQGLAENNFVAVSGKKIGTVSKLNFITRKDSLYVEADLKLRNEFAGLVTKDSKATIKSLGVLGDKYVDIITGNGSPVNNGDYIALQTEDGMAGLATNASRTITKINQLLDQLNGGKGTVGRLISDEQMGAELQETVTNLKTTSARLSKLTDELSNGDGLLPKLMNDKALAKNTEETITHLNEAAAKTESLMTKLNNDQGTIGKLHSSPELYNNLTQTLASLDSLLTDLKQNPKRYVRFSLF
jgi:phospholipid/cholesterol/gamma-HCH transport system substrate-binding protein